MAGFRLIEVPRFRFAPSQRRRSSEDLLKIGGTAIINCQRRLKEAEGPDGLQKLTCLDDKFRDQPSKSQRTQGCRIDSATRALLSKRGNEKQP